MRMTLDITITPDGRVKADVVGGQGETCITEILAGLEALLGLATVTKLKPEYEWDEQAVRMLQQQEVRA